MDNSLMYKTQTRRLFHCAVKIKLPARCADHIFDDCFKIMSYISSKYNAHDSTSYFHMLNQQSGEFVTLDETAIHLLNLLKLAAQASHGAYDFTIMPLLKLWGFYQELATDIPSLEQIKNVLALVDFRKVEIKGLQAKLAKNQEMATGSFIKSFAVDQVILYLKQQGISDALVNAGGSTISCLNNDTHPYWTVSFSTGEDESLQNFQLRLRNQSFSLSTVMNNFIVVDQVKCGHILSPTTGQPSRNLVCAVVSDLAFYSDVFSTSLFAQQSEKMHLSIQSLSHLFPFDYFILDDQQEIHMSKSFREAMIADA